MSNFDDDIAKTIGKDGSPKPGKSLNRAVGAGMAAVLVIAIGLVWFTTETAQTYEYKTQEAKRGDLKVTVSATGNLSPINQVEVGSELSGIIRSVQADYNDHVEKGQVLARLDTDKLQAEVLQFRASLKSAQAKVLQVHATLRESKNALERLKKAYELSNGRVPSKNDLDTAEAVFERAQADLASNEAQVVQAEAMLRADEADLGKAIIRSPIDGIVLTRSIEPGQTMAASLSAPVLFILAEDLTRMELLAGVDEADVGSVKAGQGATFTVGAYPNRQFKSVVTQVRYGSTTSSNVVTYKTVLRVDNTDLLLRPGMTATADIVVREVKDAILVPNSALRFSPPQQVPDSNADPSGGGILMKILPHPPRTPAKNQTEGAAKNRQKVWTFAGNKPVPILITTGTTDGSMTEVVKGDIMPGMPLIVDAVSKKGS
jgi:HlyD family secretion protein